MSATAGWQRAPEDLERSEQLRHQARGLMAKGQFGEAVPLLRQAVDLDAWSINHHLLGECLLETGNVREGILHLAAAAGLGHNQFKSRVRLAEALYQLGAQFHHDALWHLQDALRINPTYKRARRLLTEWVTEEPALREHLDHDWKFTGLQQ